VLTVERKIARFMKIDMEQAIQGIMEKGKKSNVYDDHR